MILSYIAIFWSVNALWGQLQDDSTEADPKLTVGIFRIGICFIKVLKGFPSFCQAKASCALLPKANN